jgi:hypothetical protein
MNKTEMLEKLKVTGTQAIKVSIVAGAMVIGFFIGDVYHRMNRNSESKAPLNLKVVHTLKETSVAINERNELLVIDRQNGAYEIYDDSVGRVIFRLYASQMMAQSNQ